MRRRLGRNDRGIERAGGDPFDEAFGQILMENERHRRQLFGEPRKDEGHQIGAERRDNAEMQRAGEGIAARLADRDDLVRGGDGAAGVG